MKEFVVYRILWADEKGMKPLDYYDDELVDELLGLLTRNGVSPRDLIVPDSPIKWEKFEQRRYMGLPILKKMNYHQRTSGVKVSFTAQLRYNDD